MPDKIKEPEKKKAASSSSDSNSSSSWSRSRSSSGNSVSGSSSSSRSSSTNTTGTTSTDVSTEKPRIRKKSLQSPKRKKRSPPPRPTKVHVGKLTRNVTREHMQEIFLVYGTIKHLEMLPDRAHPNFSKGFAYVDYLTPEEAEKAVEHMDGGQIDGQEVTAQTVLPPRPQPRPAHRSPIPIRRAAPPTGRWRPSPPPRYRETRRSPPRRKSPPPRRSRSRSPVKQQKWHSRSRSSSSG